MTQLFLNNFQSQFIAAVKSAPESGAPASELDYGVLRISDGAAGVLLNPSAGNWYVLTAFKRTGTLEHSHEVMRVTTVDNSVVGECRLTVARGQEGTAPTAYAAGDMIELRLTAGAMDEFAQKVDPRMTDPRTPTGPASGVLSGQYPNPGFAQPMATVAEVALKVDKVAGKGLSANDFDNPAVAKLAGIAEQATKNATDAQLRSRSTHTGEQAISTVTGLQGALDSKVAVVAGKGLSTEDYTTAEKTKLSGVAAGATANATDAQLRDRGTHTGSQEISTVAGLQPALDAKQAALVSGTNIKTVNGESLVGAGNVTINASDPNAMPKAGGAFAGQVQTMTNTGAVTGGGGSTFQVMGNASNAAYMSFHRSSAYAINFGLDTDNVVRMGGWSQGAGSTRFSIGADGAFTATNNVTAYSDASLKRDITTIAGALGLVLKMRGVFFRRKDDQTNRRHVGVIAQEMREVLPEVVNENKDQADSDEVTLSVAYGNITGVLIEAVKELAAEITELKESRV